MDCLIIVLSAVVAPVASTFNEVLTTSRISEVVRLLAGVH